MIRGRGAAALLAAMSLAACGGGDAPAPRILPASPPASQTIASVPANCPLPQGFETQAAEVVTLTNAFRAEQGLPPLGVNAKLQLAAQNFACEMARTGNFDHTGTGGSTPSDRVERAGYNWDFVAENIAFGQPFASGVFANWQSSTGHRKNMVSAEAEEIGIGIAAASTGRLYWVMVLGSQFDITALGG